MLGDPAATDLAGRRIAEQARARPAHYVAFDLLQDGRGQELLNQPLHQRRRALQRLLASAPAQLVVCPHTDDRQLAETWLADMGIVGSKVLSSKTPQACISPVWWAG